MRKGRTYVLMIAITLMLTVYDRQMAGGMPKDLFFRVLHEVLHALEAWTEDMIYGFVNWDDY